MTPNPFLGVFFHWLGGLASGSFYVPYRFVRQWSWETYWLTGGFFSWIIAPWLLVRAGRRRPDQGDRSPAWHDDSLARAACPDRTAPGRVHDKLHLVHDPASEEQDGLPVPQPRQPRVADSRGRNDHRDDHRRTQRGGRRACDEAGERRYLGACPPVLELPILRPGGHDLVLPVFLLHHGRDPDGTVQVLELDSAHGQHHDLQHPLGNRAAGMGGNQPAHQASRRSYPARAHRFDRDHRLRQLAGLDGNTLMPGSSAWPRGPQTGACRSLSSFLQS